jgi:hypothetical protein
LAEGISQLLVVSSQMPEILANNLVYKTKPLAGPERILLVSVRQGQASLPGYSFAISPQPPLLKLYKESAYSYDPTSYWRPPVMNSSARPGDR